MRLLGDNGAGYELAQRLEENAVWRAWLGERDYGLLQAYLATPGTWSAFMQTENPSVIALQLRVRALLFDKALVSLHLDSVAASPPSALDNSFLQLHADSVYFTLEQDAEDWARLQAEKNPALAALQVKHGLDSSATFSRLHDLESGHGRPNKAPQSSQSVSSALISPRQLAGRTHAKTGFNIAGHAIDHRSLGELWYTQYLQRDLMNRMNRLARRTAQRGLPFGDQEACLRTSTEMSDYVSNQANHRKRRPVFRVDGDLKQSLSGHERSVQGDDSALFMPENQYPGNCVPDNAIPARQNLSLDGFSAHGAFLDRLHHMRDLSSGLFIRGKDRLGPAAEVSNQHVRKDTVGRGNSKEIGCKNGCSEEAAQQLAEQAVVRLVAAAGFDGLKQAPLRILADLLRCHVQKLGSALRRTVDTYKIECSQAELLKMCIHGASGSKLEELMEYAKSTQPQKRRPAPVQMPQPTIQQALVQQQISPHPFPVSKVIPYQHIQGQEMEPGNKMFANRRQSSSPPGSNRRNRFWPFGYDARPGGELAIESATVADGLSQIPNQPFSQGIMSWSPQAPNFAVLPQVDEPPILQRFKQQLSPLQIPPLQQNSSYVRDSGALKLPSPQIQGLVDISVSDSVKNELGDLGEGSQFSPSRRKWKQNQRSWGFTE